MTDNASAIAAVLGRHQQLIRDALAADPTSLQPYDPAEIAAIWDQLHFDADTVARWFKARCYNPLAAKDLQQAGITTEQAATRTTVGKGGPDTIAFKLSSSQLTISEALAQLGERPAPDQNDGAQIAKQLDQLRKALAELVEQLRDHATDPATIANTTAELLDAIKRTAIALSYLRQSAQQLGEQHSIRDPDRFADLLLDAAAQLNHAHDKHAPEILDQLQTEAG